MDEQAFADLAKRELPRLIRLCTALTGSGASAEDLAQETLLEAWRARGAVYDAGGAASWLSAIARNVCLRWRRSLRGVQVVTSSSLSVSLEDIETDSGIDREIDVERSDLVDLLDRALALLPREARTLLTQRYAEELPVREMAARQHISEGAMTLRLRRSRQTLKRVLATHLHTDAVAFGLYANGMSNWQETRIWCPMCGHGKLRIQRDPEKTSFLAECTVCRLQWSDHTAGYLSEVRGPWRTMSRMNREAHRYYRDALQEGGAACACCGGRAVLSRSLPSPLRGPGVHLQCEGCHAVSYQPRIGLVLTLPYVERFWQQHRRIHVDREHEVQRDGRTIAVTSLRSVTGTAVLDVLSDSMTSEVIEAHGAPTEMGSIV